MRFNTLEGLFTDPGFLCIFLTILIVVCNILIGVSILPSDKRRKGYKTHRYVYFLVLAAYALFLSARHDLPGTAVFEYIVLFYFLVAVPWTKGINITLHAIAASVGLVLLVLVATLGVL
ncbi:MAG: hypothetical protein HZA02_06720 [Nitrospinae bacterium]|nr:hypothetical protein [Nitrospinota bacterium]